MLTMTVVGYSILSMRAEVYAHSFGEQYPMVGNVPFGSCLTSAT